MSQPNSKPVSRLALGIEYDGTQYSGLQAQQGVDTIQARLEAALCRVADAPIEIEYSGRTDKGVHASGQVIHFDPPRLRDHRAWLLGTNSYLPPDIRVRWVHDVSEDFHARYSAQSRRYQYCIYNDGVRSSLVRDRTTWHYYPLDADIMHQAAQHLLGEHDFNAYRATSCQAKHAVRTISDISVTRRGKIIVLDVSANGFLHHMVRNIAGVLMTIGEGRAPLDWSKTVLDSRDRSQGGITAPAEGLYLLHITYPEHFQLPNQADDIMLFGC